MPELRQRQPRVTDPAFLKFVRTKPCCSCGKPPPSQAAHIRMANLTLGKRAVGVGERPDDKWSIPMCSRCHLGEQHRTGERLFWQRHRADPFQTAMNLYKEYQAGRK